MYIKTFYENFVSTRLLIIDMINTTQCDRQPNNFNNFEFNEKK